MKRTFFLILLILCFYSSINAQIFTEEAVVNYALTHNYDFKKAQLEKSISYEKTYEILTMGFPKVTGSLGYQNLFIPNTSIIPGDFAGKPGTFVPVQFAIKNNVTAGLNLQQLIFDGRYLVGVQAREAVKKLADFQVKISERDVKELILKSFYQAVIAEQSLGQLKSSKNILDKLYMDAQKVFKQGLIEELDVERLQYNVKTLENTINTLKTQSELATMALKLNMGFPLDSSIILIYKMNEFDQQVLKMKSDQINDHTAIQNRTEVKLLDELIRLRQYDIKQTKYGYLPSLYGAFNYGYQAMRPEFTFLSGGDWYQYGNFGLQLSVPIFDGFTRKSQVKQLSLGLEKMNLEKQQLSEALQLQSSNAKLSIINSIEEYENQSNILKLAEKIEKKTQIKYKEGVGSSYEFATAQNDRIQQYLKLLQSQMNLLMKHIEFRKTQNNL